ncbi:MAG: trypsin-like serine peptidase [Streptosporangiaceae bacterium]
MTGHAAAAIGFSLAMAVALVVMVPTAGDPVALAAPINVANANIFSGTPAVGALFFRQGGVLTHFCTASVVRSKHENLLITAAHCMQGRSLTPAGAVIFAPMYHDGRFPYGRWIVRASYTDRQWRVRQDPNDDVAFLVAGRPGRRIQKYTGGETLDTGTHLPQEVRVVGYPNAMNLPVFCDANARPFDRKNLWQMVFDCTDYTNGTSGGPFLAHVSGATGTGRVIGVIGGFEEGGYTPGISYSARFGRVIAALFRVAQATS